MYMQRRFSCNLQLPLSCYNTSQWLHIGIQFMRCSSAPSTDLQFLSITTSSGTDVDNPQSHSQARASLPVLMLCGNINPSGCNNKSPVGLNEFDNSAQLQSLANVFSGLGHEVPRKKGSHSALLHRPQKSDEYIRKRRCYWISNDKRERSSSSISNSKALRLDSLESKRIEGSSSQSQNVSKTDNHTSEVTTDGTDTRRSVIVAQECAVSEESQSECHTSDIIPTMNTRRVNIETESYTEKHGRMQNINNEMSQSNSNNQSQIARIQTLPQHDVQTIPSMRSPESGRQTIQHHYTYDELLRIHSEAESMNQITYTGNTLQIPTIALQYQRQTLHSDNSMATFNIPSISRFVSRSHRRPHQHRRFAFPDHSQSRDQYSTANRRRSDHSGSARHSNQPFRHGGQPRPYLPQRSIDPLISSPHAIRDRGVSHLNDLGTHPRPFQTLHYYSSRSSFVKNPP